MCRDIPTHEYSFYPFAFGILSVILQQINKQEQIKTIDIMKRIYYFITMLLLAATPAMLTSCDPDDDPWYDDYYGDWYDDYDWYDKPFDHGNNQLVSMAQTLNGTWTGTVVNQYTENGEAQQTQCNATFSFVQYTQNSNNGNGYETDEVPVYDSDGNAVLGDDGKQKYQKQTLTFKWYVDPRTYNIYVEYTESGYRYVLDFNGQSDTSGFFLGYDDKSDKEIFNGVMEGVNNDELVFIDLDRVTGRSAATTRAAGATGTASLSFGKGNVVKRANNGIPQALHRR